MMGDDTTNCSPTSTVIHATHALNAFPNHQQSLGLPNLCNDKASDRKKPSRKLVRVAYDDDPHRVVIPGIICTEEEIRELWLSKSELRRNCMEAKRDISHAQESDPKYLRAFSRAFQACSTKVGTSQLLKDKNIRRMIKGSTCGSSIRGLEGKASHKALREYRRLHVQNLLKVQQWCCLQDMTGEAKWEALRSVSTKTSRTPRTLARLLGHMDEYQLNLLLRQELSA
jgi:hypothetical protein